MNPTEMIITILGSSVLASVITAFITKSVQDKSDKLKYITDERRRWRDDIRKATLDLYRIEKCGNEGFISVAEAKTFFRIRLNPTDDADNNILDLIRNDPDGRISSQDLNNISIEVAYLLKHDWERAKKEASQTGFTSLYYKTILSIGLIVIAFNVEWLVSFTTDELNMLFHDNIPINGMITYFPLFILILIPIIVIGAESLIKHLLKKVCNSSNPWCLYTCTILGIPYRQSTKKENINHAKNNQI